MGLPRPGDEIVGAGVFPVSSEEEEQLPTAFPRSPLSLHLSVGLDLGVAVYQSSCLSAASTACGAVVSDSLTKDLLWDLPWAETRQEGTEEPQLPNCACPRVFCLYSHPRRACLAAQAQARARGQSGKAPHNSSFQGRMTGKGG